MPSEPTGVETQLPPYVERGGDLVFPPPFRARGVRNATFFLEADEAALDRLFTRSFAEPSGGAVDIRPLGGAVILSVVRIDAINSAEPPHSELSAGGPELELAFWVLGYDARRDRQVLFMPYMFVDSAAAVTAGREIFGFPKQHGLFDRDGGNPPDRLSLDVLAVRCPDPNVPFAPHRLLDLVRVAPPNGASSSRSSAAFARLTTLMSGTPLTIVLLKQFRDVAQPDRACYQAIVETTVEVTAHFGSTEQGTYEVTLHDLATEPIREHLGLPPGTLRTAAALDTHYEFVLPRGTELWRAPRP